MNLNTIADVLLKIFLGAGLTSVFSLIVNALFIFGVWGIFTKCGIKGWWALIPCAREAKLGEAAGMGREGRIAGTFQGLCILVNLIGEFPGAGTEQSGRAAIFFTIAIFVLSMFLLLYQVRIYLRLCEVFNQKKAWIIIWVLLDAIPACLWGWLKQFRPLWTADQLKGGASAVLSNAKAAVLDEGLTVNLEERTASDFFKKKVLLRDIHMYIQPGRMVLLLGGSGAGKTTYLNAINGYEKANAEVVLNGRNMYREYKDMQYDIGFVPQLDLMRGSDSVYRTLMDAASLRLPVEYSKADREARVEEVMKIFGLTPVKDNLVVKLSGGQRKRLSIAMEFISNPSLFILDEPDSGLDGVMARELFQQLRRIADAGKIIIVITHTPDRVIDLFDDVIVLAKDSARTGRLAYYGPIEEARAFFGKERMEEIVKSINRTEEGGEGRADEFITKYAEVQHA